MQDSAKFWLNWLQSTAVLFGIFGVILFALPFAENTVGEFYYEQIVGADTYAHLSADEIDFQQFLYGVAGAVLASWQLLVYFITRHALKKGETWAWTAIVASLALWFVGDGYVSIRMGFPIHAGMNLSMLILQGIPLMLIKKQI